MEIIVVTIVFVISFLWIINFINRSVKEGEICQCDSKPGGCHKGKASGSCH